MRRNKKVLLASIAALAVLAVGTGAVSTFAWYTTSAAATAKSAIDSVTIGTALENAAGIDVTVNFTFTTTTPPELTDSTGTPQYYVGGVKKPGSGNGVGTYGVSIAWAGDGQAIWNASTHNTEETYTVALTSGNSRVKLLSDNTSSADANVAASHTLTFKIAANGGLTLTTTSGYFAVRGIDSEENKTSLETTLSAVATFSLANPVKQ